MRGRLQFDGGARPTNPGHSGFAFLIQLEDERVIEFSRYMGWGTNNEAEYAGLIVGLKYARLLGVDRIHIISDSKLVVNQVKGSWRVNNFIMKQMSDEARLLLRQYDEWTLAWKRRSNNKECDALCTKAINWGRNQNPLVPQSIKLNRLGEIHDPFDASIRLSQSSALRAQQSSARIELALSTE